METENRPDEWKIEQGLSGAKLPFLDQTGRETIAIHPKKWGELTKDEAAIQAVGDRDELFARELEGWIGYVPLTELVSCSDRTYLAANILLSDMWNGRSIRRKR